MEADAHHLKGELDKPTHIQHYVKVLSHHNLEYF